MKPQILRGLRFLFSLVVACGPAGVPGAGGPGRCVCRWAVARPRAVRAASFARRVASKPGQAPPPPTGTAADPSGALHTGGAVSLECDWVRRVEARPGPVSRSVPYPQFRMQFPDTCNSSLSEKPGISTITFQSMKCMWGNCMRVFWGSGHIDTCWWRSRNPRARWAGCLKSPSPLLARARVGLKPLSPLRARNGCFWCSFRVQR